jgi:hypothetical protein
MAKIRCSNCEKAIKKRIQDGTILIENECNATGEFISSGTRSRPKTDPYYQPRKCDEFLPRLEYSQQFRTIFDQVIKGLAVGKEVKNILK